MFSPREPILPQPRATFKRVVSRVRSSQGLWVICLSLFLTACASAPQVTDKPVSQFNDPAPAASPLVDLAISKPHSGIRLLADPSEALQSRLQLAALATTTLDIQYYLWQADNSGLALTH
jgi:putative cardiolipin synthase